MTIKNDITPNDVEWTMRWSAFKDTADKPDELIFEADKALAHLLINEVIFLNSLWWEKDCPKHVQESIAVYVNCNDIFAWACADGENLPYEQIESLYKLWVNDTSWGAVKWCCIQRNQKPQKPVEDDMRKAGAWDDVMEQLGKNTEDAAVHAALGISHPGIPEKPSFWKRLFNSLMGRL